MSTDTLVRLLEQAAENRPDSLAYGFLRGGEHLDHTITYGRLDREARCVAGWLHQRAERGEPVLLIYPTGIDLIVALFGCLYAGNLGITTNLPRYERDRERLLVLASDAGARTMLGTRETLRQVESTAQSSAFTATLATDVPEALDGASLRSPVAASPGDAAYLQYTSGSTSVPRGVVVTHENAIHNVRAMQERLHVDASSVFVSWLPHSHDLGLVYGILLALQGGAPAYLMTPSAFVQRPARWLQAISRFGGTHTACPNFAFDLCVERTTEAQRRGLDLSTWQVAGNGAEPIRAMSHRRFAETFEPYGFRSETLLPIYGLAESTLIVTCGKPGAHSPSVQVDPSQLDRGVIEPSDAISAREFVSCGTPLSGLRVEIVDPTTRHRTPPHEVGEVWVRGDSVSPGYWQRGEENDGQFRAQIIGAEGAYLRTGDLGFVKNGELFITGRHKDVIIISGRNLYPQDIELAVENSHERIRSNAAVAFRATAAGEEGVVIVAEVAEAGRESGEAKAKLAREMLRAVRRAVSQEFDVSVHDIVLVRPGGVGKTTSGKVQRRRCRAKYLRGDFPVSSLMQSAFSREAASELEKSLGDPFDDESPVSFAAATACDEDDSFPDASMEALHAAGINRRLVPVELGGALGSYEDLHATMRAVARRDATLAVATLTTILGSTPVWIAGTDEQRQRVADTVLSDQCLSFGLTERAKGGDVLASELQAELSDADEYLVSGEKWLIGNATRSAAMLAFARTRPQGGPRGFSLMLVNKRDAKSGGIRPLPKIRTNGIRGADISGLAFDRCRVPTNARIGEEGNGFELLLKSFQVSRSLVPAISLGLLDTALRTTLRFASRRQLYGRSMLDLPEVRFELAGVFSRLLMSDCVASLVVRTIHTEPAQMSLYSAVAKFFIPTLNDGGLSDLARVLGARHYLRDEHDHGIFAKVLRDHSILGVFDGSTYVNRQSISQQLPQIALGWQTREPDFSPLRTPKLRLAGRLPAVAYGRFDLVNRGKDTLLQEAIATARSLPEELEGVIDSSGNYATILALAANLVFEIEALRERVSELSGASGAPRVRAAMSQCASRYCDLLAAGICLGVWRNERVALGGYFAEGDWLVLAMRDRLGTARALQPQHTAEDYERAGRLADRLSALAAAGDQFSAVPLRLPSAPDNEKQRTGSVAHA